MRLNNLKPSIYILMILFGSFSKVFAQDSNENLVDFNDLKFHSEFEKESMKNFHLNKKDTLNLFLAIDKNINNSNKDLYVTPFNKHIEDLIIHKTLSKSMNRRIELTYNSTHERFLKKYKEIEELPNSITNGSYNCVSASILYALTFDKVKIPYKVMATINHVYIVANPGPQSIVIETTNPSFEKQIFTGEFKRQYTENLLNTKQISKNDYNNKSAEEIFEKNFREVNDAEFKNLIGFQYYNLGLKQIQANNYEEASILLQKALFFYPTDQVRYLLNNALLMYIQKSKFSRVEEIDFLVQYAKLGTSNTNLINNLFNNIISHYMQFNNKEQYCDSLFKRFVSKFDNKSYIDEVSFDYYLQMSNKTQNKTLAQDYAIKAFTLQPEHKAAISRLTNILINKLENISNPTELLDTLNNIEKSFTGLQNIKGFRYFKTTAYLKIAKDRFKNDKLVDGEKFLRLFDEIYDKEESIVYRYEIEQTYYAYYSYFHRKGDKINRKNVQRKISKYFPDSYILSL